MYVFGRTWLNSGKAMLTVSIKVTVKKSNFMHSMCFSNTNPINFCRTGPEANLVYSVWQAKNVTLLETKRPCAPAVNTQMTSLRIIWLNYNICRIRRDQMSPRHTDSYSECNVRIVRRNLTLRLHHRNVILP